MVDQTWNPKTFVIELRDVNYPGSKYSLRDDPATDRLQVVTCRL